MYRPSEQTDSTAYPLHVHGVHVDPTVQGGRLLNRLEVESDTVWVRVGDGQREVVPGNESRSTQRCQVKRNKRKMVDLTFSGNLSMSSQAAFPTGAQLVPTWAQLGPYGMLLGLVDLYRYIVSENDLVNHTCTQKVHITYSQHSRRRL